VSLRQDGFEHLTPTRFARMSSVCFEKSSRAMLVVPPPNRSSRARILWDCLGG